MIKEIYLFTFVETPHKFILSGVIYEGGGGGVSGIGKKTMHLIGELTVIKEILVKYISQAASRKKLTLLGNNSILVLYCLF